MVKYQNMQIKRPKRKCWRSPSFPSQGLVGIIPIVDDQDNIYAAYTASELYENTEEFLKQTYETGQALQKKKIQIADICVIMNISFAKLVQLKPEYWQNPSINYRDVDRAMIFAESIRYPGLYSVLVTPAGRKKRHDILHATIPLLRSNETEQLDKFMKLSDYPVDQTAKSAAIYNIDMIMGISLKNGQYTKTPLFNQVRINNLH